jgi:hypothetical protein
MRGLTEEQVLENFALILEHIKTLPAPVMPEKAAPKEAAPSTGETPTKGPADRLELIKRVAEQHGVAVSDDTLAEAGELDQSLLPDPESTEELPDAGS